MVLQMQIPKATTQERAKGIDYPRPPLSGSTKGRLDNSQVESSCTPPPRGCPAESAPCGKNVFYVKVYQ